MMLLDALLKAENMPPEEYGRTVWSGTSSLGFLLAMLSFRVGESCMCNVRGVCLVAPFGGLMTVLNLISDKNFIA